MMMAVVDMGQHRTDRIGGSHTTVNKILPSKGIVFSIEHIHYLDNSCNGGGLLNVGRRSDRPNEACR
jgi:hypothetical protein